MPRDPRQTATYLDDFRATRRQLLAAATGLTASLAFTTVSAGAQSATPAESIPINGAQADGTWVFTDDRGVTVTLAQPPTRVFANINAAAPLWDFGIRPIATYSAYGPENPLWGSVDRDLPNLATSDLNVDVEALLGLQPELYVVVTWNPEELIDVWGLAPELYEAVNAVVPIISISAQGLPQDGIARFQALAESLGADLQSAEITAARDAFEQALTTLDETAREKEDLTVLFTYILAQEDWLAARPGDWPELEMYKQLGVNIVETAANPGDYWESISREEALKYSTDILVNANGVGLLTLEELREDLTFSLHPAVVAGQVGDWQNDFIMSYQGMTEPVRKLTALLQDSEKIT